MQLPVPGAPEKRVHCEMVKAPPRMPSISRLLADTSDATGLGGEREKEVAGAGFWSKVLTAESTASSIWWVAVLVVRPGLYVDLPAELVASFTVSWT